MTDWTQLLNSARRRVSQSQNTRPQGRTQFERDYDRILFCTPVRRMADKTQVFPLEAHDAVHTRLTHSLEVSTLARSMGVDLATRFAHAIGLGPSASILRDVPALLAAVGLVHDIGNPPFGHQGESAIRAWFSSNKTTVFPDSARVSPRLQSDFLLFEGNAQAFRLVTTLQLQGDEYGLNLTYGTLATLLKYSVSADRADKKHPLAGRHKPGFFASEASIANEVWRATGLEPEQRHPLAYVVEACDDIAYGVIDTEDTVKKRLASFADVAHHLSDTGGASDAVVDKVIKYAGEQRKKVTESTGGRFLSPHELDDLTMQHFRVAAISEMVECALDAFVANHSAIAQGTFEGDLLSGSPSRTLRDALKTFRERVTFPHRSILEIELEGSQVIHELMDRLWAAIVDREDPNDVTSRRPNRLAAYTYGRISENYRRVFERFPGPLPIRYREAQLLTDMLSGMTDTFALSLLKDLRRFDVKRRR